MDEKNFCLDCRHMTLFFEYINGNSASTASFIGTPSPSSFHVYFVKLLVQLLFDHTKKELQFRKLESKFPRRLKRVFEMIELSKVAMILLQVTFRAFVGLPHRAWKSLLILLIPLKNMMKENTKELHWKQKNQMKQNSKSTTCKE